MTVSSSGLDSEGAGTVKSLVTEEYAQGVQPAWQKEELSCSNRNGLQFMQRRFQ